MTIIGEHDYELLMLQKSWNIAQNKYWQLVQYTLLSILEQPGKLKEIDKLKDSLWSRPIQEQILFYHAEPLDVAIDLSNREYAQIEDAEIQGYLNFAQRIGWNSEEFMREKWFFK